MRPGKRKSRYALRERDYAFMGFVKTLPCAVANELGLGVNCEGVVEAAHVGDRAYGRKAPDDTCIPLCRHHHHVEQHGVRGFFATMDKLERIAWYDRTIRATRAKYRQYKEGLEILKF